MHKLERKKQIMETLKKEKFIKISDLYKIANFKIISAMTINRDLNELKKQGLIETTWGAIQIPGYNFLKVEEKSRNDKILINHFEKIKIVQKAAQIIKENSTIFIGTGTTLEEIVNYLEGKKVTLVTNSHFVAINAVKYKNINLIVIGGELRKKSGAYVGNLALKVISLLNFDYCFIGANGIDHKGIYNSNLSEASINTKVLKRSKYRYLLITNEKINLTGFINFFDPKNIDYVITNVFSNKKSLSLTQNYDNFLKFIFV